MTVKVVVWVAVQGCYSDTFVAGVFPSAEAAMVALPGENWAEEEGWRNGRTGDRKVWTNDLDWGQAVTIEPFEVVPIKEKVRA